MTIRNWGAGLAVAVAAVGVAIVAAVIIFGGGEPDFDEAMHELVREPGVGSVQRVTISREPCRWTSTVTDCWRCPRDTMDIAEGQWNRNDESRCPWFSVCTVTAATSWNRTPISGCRS